jgi:hypothetical protein
LDSSVLITLPDVQREGSPVRMGPGVGVNQWLFAASISCLSKRLKPESLHKMF